MHIHEAGRLTRSGVLDVGLKCAHSCRFCYYSFLDNSPDQFRGIRKAKFRSAEECMDILRLLHDGGLDHFDYTGGEPSLHPDIVTITEFAHQELRMKGRMITLGQYLMKKIKNCRRAHLLEDLLDAGITNFLFSIHAVDETLFKGLTGGSFIKLRSAMDYLDEKGFAYTGNTAVCNLNMKELPRIADELVSHNLYMHNFILMNAYYEWSKGGKALGVQARYADIRPYLQEAVSILEESGIVVNIRYAPMCTVRGMEKHLVGITGVRYDPYEWRNLGGHFGGSPEECARFVPIREGDVEEAFRFSEIKGNLDGLQIIGMRGNHVKYFPGRCKKCTAVNVCDGIDPNYLQAHGEDELMPYEEIQTVGVLTAERLGYRSAFIMKTEQFEDMKAQIRVAIEEGSVGKSDRARYRVSPPSVSVIITCYNYGRYLEQCVRSVVSQTFTDVEIIIVNDGSTDDTIDVAERLIAGTTTHAIKLITQENSGQPAIARNRGIAEARGRYILCLDADDLIHPEMIRLCVRVLEERPDIAIAYTDRRDFDGVEQIVNAGEYNFQKLRYANHISYCALFRREVWEAVGGYRENVRGMEDWDFWIAAGAKGFHGLRIAEPLFLYRRHDTGVYQDVLRDSERIFANIVLNNAEVYEKGDIEKAGKILSDTEVDRKKGTPAVSVIIPTRNRPEMLVTAIRSVLDQSFRDFEIIVVNDAGMDVENIISFLNAEGNIVYVRHDRRRDRSAARNTALKLARGRYIAYLDDDDIYYPDHLETLVNYLESSRFSVAYTDAYRSIMTKEKGRYISERKDIPYSYDFSDRTLLVSNYIPILCVMHERACIEKAGMFDESFSTHEDWDLWIRISRHYPFAHIKKVTCEFTWWQDGSSTISQMKNDFQRTRRIIYERYREYAREDIEVLQAQNEMLIRYEPEPHRHSEDDINTKITSLIREKKTDEALDLLIGIVERDEADRDLVTMLCDVAKDSRRINEVRQSIKEYLSLHMADIEILCRYAEICVKSGDDHEAIGAVNRVFIFDPDNKKAIAVRNMLTKRQVTQKAAT